MSRRLAFGALALLSALGFVQCSSSDAQPNIETGGDDGGVNTGNRDATAPDTGPVLTGSGTPTYAITLSQSAVDFGLVPCGSAATRQLVTVNNTGNQTETLGYAFLSGSGAFTASFDALGGAGDGGAASVTLRGGEQASLVITPNPVPQTSPTTKDFYNDTLTVTTSPVIQSTTATPLQIAVTETAQGGILQFLPTGANFSSVPVDTTVTSAFQVVNGGNADVEVTLAPSLPVFGVSQLGPVPVPAGSNLPLNATYSPVDTSASSGAIHLSATGTLCSPLPSDFTVQGNGTSGVVQIDTSPLLFGTNGLQACGTQANGQTVTITNAGNAPFSYTATITQGAANFQTLTNASNTIEPGHSAQVGVQPNGIPQQSAVTPDLYSGTLSITTTAPDDDTAHVIPLHMTAQGILLTVTAAQVNFGGVAVDQTATAQFSITNNGNAPLANATIQNSQSVFSVNAGSATPLVFTFSLDTTPTGKTVVPTISFTPPDTKTYADSITFSIPAGVVNCGATPADIQLNGSGTTGIAVTPTDLNFGSVQCPAAINVGDGGVQEGPAQQAASQQITITNQGAAATYKVNLGLGTASPYTITNIGNATIAQGTFVALPSGSTVINVVPNPVVRPAPTAADGLADNLTITSTSPGDAAPHVIGLHETAQGAVLAYTPAQLTPTDAVAAHTTFQDFTITNSGNISVNYTVNVATKPSTIVSSGLFALNLPAAGSLQQLFASQTQPGVLETTSNNCPVAAAGGTVECPSGASAPCVCSAAPWQLLGQISLAPQNGSILCSDPPPVMPLSEN